MKKHTILLCINMLREKSETAFEFNYHPYLILNVELYVCSGHCFQVSAAEILGSRGFPTFEVSFDCTINGLSKVHCKCFNLLISSQTCTC